MMFSDRAVPVPFEEAPWLDGIPFPYYSSTHRKWQKTCREYFDANFTPFVVQWQTEGHVPASIFTRFASDGFLLPLLPAPLPVQLLKRYGIHELPGGLKLEDFDYFHYSIHTSELYRCGLWGAPGALIPGMAFGIPPIVKFGSREIQDRLLPELLSGRKRICLAITEPGAGSDVANIEATAVKTEDGRFFRVSGAKKWISNGIFSDFATMAVRTGGPGPTGISLLVVPLDQEGITCRSMNISAGHASGTTYIDMDEALVPVENLLGVEGQGLKCVLSNFNHERVSLAISATVQSRKVLSTAFEYVTRRQAFGKRLIDQPVVRHRLAKCAADLEAQWSWIEQLLYAMTRLPKHDADANLGGQTALAKARAGKVLEKSVSSAQLLLGGNSVTRGGQGELIEMISREVALTRVPGGSEDVLLDLSIRVLLKQYDNRLQELKASL